MGGVGALVTLELPDDSPVLTLPWIITFGPLSDDEEWDPVVCGPYERPHAMALAESVVADQELMAVVEPLQPHLTVEQNRDDIATAKRTAELESAGADHDHGHDCDHDHGHDHGSTGGAGGLEHADPSPPPSCDEVRDGFARIAARLISLRAPV